MSYGDVPVFEGVKLRVEAGEFVALLGESGVGNGCNAAPCPRNRQQLTCFAVM